MTTEFDDLFVPLASELLAMFGKDMVLSRITQGAYNPATLTQSSTTVTYPVKGSIQNLGRKYASEIMSGLVRTSDSWVVLAANDFPVVPHDGDKITFDGNDWTILLVMPTYSGELIATYEVAIRK